MKYSTQEIIDQLIKHEGIVLHPYKDSLHITTLGIGRNLESRGIDPFELDMIGFSPEKDVFDIKEITKEDAIWLCQNDVFRCEKEMAIFFPPINDLPKIRQLVLIDMLFNLGMSRLSKFIKLFRALEGRDYKKASAEMIDSLWAKQVKGRADSLAHMMRYDRPE